MLTKEQRELKHQRETIELQYRQRQEDSEAEGKLLVYPNQREAACECLYHYETGKMLVLLVAQPGTGKTGTALELLRLMCTHIDDDKCMKTSNIHIISGMNDTDWRDQFQEKMLPALGANVKHRGILNKSRDDIANINNGMIVTDECHIASDKNMTVSKLIRSVGLTDLQVVADRRVKMFDISATPEAEGWDIEAWGEKAAIVRLMPGPTYKGFEVMLNEGRIKQAEPLSTLDSTRKLFKFFNDRYANSSKKYFPMRIQSQDWMENIYKVLVEFGWTFISHNSNERVVNIDHIMTMAPSRHTIIFIKEFWRASKRLVRTHVGGSYESVPKTRNVSTASQGLIGRFCDNYSYTGDEVNPDLRPVHFGDKESIEAYVRWFNEGCDYRKVNYSSTRINSTNGYVVAKESKLHASNFVNLNPVSFKNGDPNLHKRIPVVVQMNEETINIIRRAQKEVSTECAINIIRNLLRQQLYTKRRFGEFIAIISNSPCFQLSTPKTGSQRSYEIHINDVVDAAKTNKKYGLMDCKEEFKNITCWQVYLDTKEHRICVLWQVIINIHDIEELVN